MEHSRNQKEKYITLKEAAKISGYAPDYIGQLIRRGKLPGKQVYCTIAWMTTEEALRRYLAKNHTKNGTPSWKETVVEKFQQIKTYLLLEFKLARLFRTVLYLAIGLAAGFTILLFYVFSVSFDKKLEQAAIQKLEQQKNDHFR